jgi:glycosyltransferase involved in cell wall biosynthesis
MVEVVEDTNKTIALLVMTDGRRNYIHQTLASAQSELFGSITHKFIHDDSGDETNHEWLRQNFPDFTILHRPTRQGFGGAINSAWRFLRDYDFKYVFHLEDDFTFNRPVLLNDMIKVLEENPHVYQMALCRQPWNEQEKKAGGIMQCWPDEYTQQDGFVAHKLFFTSNPNLYRKSLVDMWDYPTMIGAESHFATDLLSFDPNIRFGFWGQKYETPWVTHIGVIRSKGVY